MVSRQKPQRLEDVVDLGPSRGVHVCFGFQIVKRVSRAIPVLDLHRNLMCRRQMQDKK